MDDRVKSIILSLLVGAVLGILLFKLTLGGHVKHGPNSKDIVGKIYRKDGRCYEFKPVVTICPSSISMNGDKH